MAKTKDPASRQPLDQEVPKEGYEKIEEFVSNNGKIIIGVLTVFALAIGGYFAYTNLVLNPREEQAQEKIVAAQQFFQQDSLQLALNGDGFEAGFLQVADRYGSTPTGKLAHYYSGVCYLRLGEYDNAIKHLKKYSSPDPILSAQAVGSLGHAYSEKGNNDQAVSSYRRAAEMAGSAPISPFFYQCAGELSLSMGKSAEAKRYFEMIKKEYPDSEEGRNIDKYIALADAAQG